MILKTRLQNNVTGIAALALGYALVGRIALMLAIPPGYATAIFPSAGIAVAALLIWGYRLWPGVFLGSFILNTWITLAQGSLTLPVMSVSLAAASGASLQAIIGAWLVRRTIGTTISLSKETDIASFFTLAGPVSCVINASFGVTSLYLSGAIKLSEYGYSWFTWWVGDAIGVLIMAPLMFIAFAQPRQLWQQRRVVVAVPLMFVLILLIGLFIWVSKWELERTQFEFREISSHTHERLRSRFEGYVDAIAAIERLFSSVKTVSRAEFRNFVEYTLSNNPGLNGVSWNPVVANRDRAAFEAKVRREGFPDFRIYERNKNNQLVPVDPTRSQYIVVDYIEPLERNKTAMGFDVASTIKRRKALLKSRDSGEAIATSRITLVQDKTKQAGLLLFYPVYAGLHNTLEQRRLNLRGFAVGVFRVGDIVEEVLSRLGNNRPMIAIYDENDTSNHQPLYGQPIPSATLSKQLYWSDTLDIGGRQWRAFYWPTNRYIVSHRGWQAWTALVAGLLFASLLSAFLLAMSGRSYHTESLVAIRTAELSGILNTAIETILTINQEGRIESINPAGEALFQYSAKELIGMPVKQLIPEFSTESNSTALDNNANAFIEGRRDAHATRKDNTSIPVELAVSVFKVSDRHLYIAVVHDLTERRKVERMKDEFISIVSHELRTPLTSIKGALGLINSGAFKTEPEKLQNVMTIAYQNTHRLESLVNDLLTFEKWEVAENQLQLQLHHIHELVSRAIVANQGYADNYNVHYRWSPADDTDVTVMVDENRMMQVFANLLSNAVKYSPQDGEVEITASRERNIIRVSVTDHGPGIPLEFQGKIFEKFSQADSSTTRRVGGTGLGLAISKKIIENHGGTLAFDSTPGEGATFYFELAVVEG